MSSLSREKVKKIIKEAREENKIPDLCWSGTPEELKALIEESCKL